VEKTKPSFEEALESVRQFGKTTAAVAPKLETFWQIVVVGHIDFRQHTPFWYKQIEALSEEEFKQAEKSFSPGMFVGGPAGLGFRFNAGTFMVTCTPDRWEIATTNREHQTRIVDILALVFDSKLFELSVFAFGINTHLVLSTKSSDARKFFARKMVNARLGLLPPDDPDETEGNFTYKRVSKNGTTLIHLYGSPLKKSDAIAFYNLEFQVPKQGGYFHLGNLVRPKVSPSWQEAEDFGSRLLYEINKMED
jgi:hypothetical protein